MYLKNFYSPYASVTVERTSGGKALEQFPGEFERSLCAHFESVEVRRPRWLRRFVVMVLLLRKDSACAVLKRSGAPWDDWKVMIDAGSPFARDQFGSRRMDPKTADLRGICREVHSLLTGISGVSRVYWYAKRLRKHTAAVWTPDELPWD